MPDFVDTPTSEGATNVALHQRAAEAPFAREEVNIKGSENAGRALGFNAEGQLTTLLVGEDEGGGVVELVDMAPLPRGVVIGRKSSGVGVPEAVTVAEMISLDVTGTKAALGKVALADMANLAQGKLIARVTTGTGVPEAVTLPQVIALDPDAVRTALHVSEDPFVSVDNEAEFDAALAAGRSMILRGEGFSGIVSLTTPKNITTRWTTIQGPGLLRFSLNQALSAHPRAITVRADDVTLQNFELFSNPATNPLASNTCYGLVFSEGTENYGHRLRLLGMHIHDWQRCLSKDGSLTTTSHDDCLIERCFCHSAKEYVSYLNFGFNRLQVRNSRFLGWLDGTAGASQLTTDNAMYGGSNWNDCLFDSCHFGNVKRMGFEATPASYDYFHRRTHLHWCRAENCGSMGFSLGYVEGGIYEKCKAINVKQCGFEVAGRVAGNPAQPVGRPSDFAQAIIESCEVDGVTHTGPAYGISLDGARDTSVRAACIISNVSSTYESAPGLNDGACGVGMTDCERCSVQLVVFNDAGHKHIYCAAIYLPLTTGFHDFSNNIFRNRNAAGGYNHRAIFIHNQSCSIRNNLAYQKSGTSLLYQAVTDSASALVCADGVPCAVGSVLFGGAPPATNLILVG